MMAVAFGIVAQQQFARIADVDGDPEHTDIAENALMFCLISSTRLEAELACNGRRGWLQATLKPDNGALLRRDGGGGQGGDGGFEVSGVKST